MIEIILRTMKWRLGRGSGQLRTGFEPIPDLAGILRVPQSPPASKIGFLTMSLSYPHYFVAASIFAPQQLLEIIIEYKSDKSLNLFYFLV